MKQIITLMILLVLIFSINTLAYEEYSISEEQFTEGYTKNLSPGDKINFPMGGNIGYVTVSSVYVNSAVFYIFAHGRQQFMGLEHPDHSDIFTHEKKFEMTEDNYYDLKVTLNSATIDENDNRVVSITLKKIHEGIPDGTEIYYDCWKYYGCSDGSKIKYCDYSETGCLCKRNPASLCPSPDTEQTCLKYYTCPDGTKVVECEIKGMGCTCSQDPASLCPSPDTEQSTCTDSDGGVNYYVKGEVEKSGVIQTDHCDLGTLTEFSCDENWLVDKKYYACPQGCEDGACVSIEGERQIECQNGCLKDSTCLPIGYRFKDEFCDVDSNFKEQKLEGISCNNNFECRSNLCIDSECIKVGLFRRILSWFKRLF